MLRNNPVKEGVEYLLLIRPFQKVMEKAIEDYSQFLIGEDDNIMKCLVPTFDLLDSEFGEVIPEDPPGFEQSLDIDELTNEWHDLLDQFDKVVANYANEDNVVISELLIRLYVTRRRWSDVYKTMYKLFDH